MREENAVKILSDRAASNVKSICRQQLYRRFVEISVRLYGQSETTFEWIGTRYVDFVGSDIRYRH
jgi:hypothetical protein